VHDYSPDGRFRRKQSSDRSSRVYDKHSILLHDRVGGIVYPTATTPGRQFLPETYRGEMSRRNEFVYNTYRPSGVLGF